MKPRHTLRYFIVAALLILSTGTVWGAVRYAGLFEEISTDEAAAELIAQQRVRFSTALEGIGVTPGAVATGFWYTYVDAEGNEHVLYFDPEALARQGLSDSDLRQLTELVSKSHITEKRNMRIVPNAELPTELQFHNAIYSFGSAGVTSLDMKLALQEKVQKGTATSEELFELSYLYELEGNYAERDRLNAENCTRFKVRCTSASAVKATGRVVDNRGTPIAGARVEIVSRPDSAAVTTDENGIYTIPTGAMKMEKLRFRSTKRNFSDGYADAILLTDGVKTISVEDITLESPLTIVTVDFAKRSVTGSGNRFAENGVVVTTPNSTYEIPQGAIVDANGTPYSGPIDIYLYEFTKGNPPESLMQVDTFDQVMGYAGDLMKTFGMPYIQFFTQDGAELDVLKSKPMVLTYRIADMDALRENIDQIYSPLTEKDMQLLVEASRGQPYVIDREFLINNQLLRFPAFWVFDRKRGVWDNVGVSVLDTQGTITTIFYTVRDD
ncbi:MAG: hypothetical protein A2854_03550 [Parcubacteria group bacterium RIFCSPHIGHO2_01_FULL_56_18]|nr:MAG: hypothetical protein A2854_03550 [Parcubacteria group bacterium RIFCSPHIGHO2_01_FULL_56_18]